MRITWSQGFPRMSNLRSLIVDYAVYVLVRTLACIVQALSLSQGLQLAKMLASLAYHIDKRHRRVAEENLCHAFPGRYTDVQRDQLVRANYRHFACVMVEFLHLTRILHSTNWKRYVQFPEDNHLRLTLQHLLSRRPIVMVTGHFGSWEMSGLILGIMSLKAHVITRPLDNPFLHEYSRKFRDSAGQKILAKKGDFEKIQSILAEGGTLGTLGDQDAGQRGLYVDFFGRPASTHKAIALLALEHGAPIMVFFTAKAAGPLQYHLFLADVILPETYEHHPDAVRAITERYTTALEQIVRRYPEQYFWLHRRWKHQPRPRARRRAA